MIQRHRGLLWRICSGFRLGSAWTADDAMQEVLVALWRAYGKYRGESSERTWVYRVAMSTLLGLNRKQSNRYAPGGESLSEAACENREEWHIRMFIDSFGEPDNIILNASLDGFSHEEIAEMTGLTVPAVASRIYRRKQQMRKEYGE
jgi:RNA polymerase sigma-70 factor (ECF subfamily)